MHFQIYAGETMIVFDGINLAKTRQQNAVMTSNIFAAYSIVMAFSSNAQLYHMPLSICKQLYALNWSTSWFSFILFNVSLHWKLEINTFRLWLVLDQNLIHRNCLTLPFFSVAPSDKVSLSFNNSTIREHLKTDASHHCLKVGNQQHNNWWAENWLFTVYFVRNVRDFRPGLVR